jgi:hypothetical protein
VAAVNIFGFRLGGGWHAYLIGFIDDYLRYMVGLELDAQLGFGDEPSGIGDRILIKYCHDRSSDCWRPTCLKKGRYRKSGNSYLLA